MPWSYELDHSRNLVKSKAWGVLTTADIHAHLTAMKELFKKGTLDPSWSQLIDFTGLTRVDLDSNDIRSFAILNPWPVAARRAFVAPRDEAFGLSRMYEMMCGEKGLNIRVFRDADEALAWLKEPVSDTPDEYIPPAKT